MAILCPGPSLRRFLETPVEHECFIGVNQAAEAWQCDWWSCGDGEAFDRFQPLGSPNIFTRKEWPTATRRKEGWGWLYHHECVTTCLREFNWFLYSTTAAMVLAEWLDAKRITVYGADMCGSGYFAPGGNGPANHSTYRWPNECYSFGRVMAWLSSRGVAVERVRVEGFEQTEA